MNKQTASEFIHQQMNDFQIYFDQCKTSYNQIQIDHLAKNIRLELDIINLAQYTKEAISKLSAFVKRNQWNLVEDGIKDLNEWQTKFQILLIERLCSSLTIIEDEEKDKCPISSSDLECQVREHLKRWLQKPMEGIGCYIYSLEVAILNRALHYFQNLLTAHCLYLNFRDAKLYERIWDMKLEELSITHYIEKRFEILLQKYPQESRTEIDYVAMRNIYLQSAPACILQDLRFNYKNPEVLIQLARKKGLTEEEFNICIGISWGLTELDKLQKRPPIEVDHQVIEVSHLSMEERKHLFYQKVFEYVQEVKYKDGKPLIRFTNDWFYVGRYLIEWKNLTHVYTYVDVFQILTDLKVSHLPKSVDNLYKVNEHFLDKWIFPHWLVKERPLAIGEATHDAVMKYKYLLEF